MINTDFNIIFWFVLGLAALGASVMAFTTLINFFRLRNVRLSWKTGKLRGYPLFSTLFLLSTFFVSAIAIGRGSTEELIMAALYSWFGFCWFTASFLSAKRLITDYGIVKNVNDPSQTIAWHQIRDFVERENEDSATYIFIYCVDESLEADNLIRLEVTVPNHLKKSFQKLISHKLGSRIRCYVDEEIDMRQINRNF